MSFLTDVRKTALLACLTSALSLLLPFWTLSQNLPAMPFATAALSLTLAFVAVITPIFYFALYRNQTPLSVPDRSRKLSLIAAVLFSIVIAADLPNLIEASSLYWTRVQAFGWSWDQDTLNLLARLVGEASNLAYLLLLIAIYRAKDREPAEISGSLEVTARVAVIVGGLWLVYNLIQTGVLPYQYWEHRQQIRAGQDSQILLYILTGPLRRLLTAGCIFVAPYVVCMRARISPEQKESCDS